MTKEQIEALEKAVIACTEGGVKFDHAPKGAPGVHHDAMAHLATIAHFVQRLYEYV